MSNLPDPKKTYVILDLWAPVLMPIEHVAVLKDVIPVDKSYNSETKSYEYSPRKEPITFQIMRPDDVARMIAVAKLEK